MGVLALLVIAVSAAAQDPCGGRLTKVRDARVLEAFGAIWAKTGSSETVLICRGLSLKIGLARIVRHDTTKEVILLLSDEVMAFKDDALRGGLAHEIGHYMLGHTSIRLPASRADRENEEKEADFAGVQLAGRDAMVAMVEAAYEVVCRLGLTSPEQARKVRERRLAWIEQSPRTHP